MSTLSERRLAPSAPAPALSAADLARRLGEDHPPTPEQAAVIEAALSPRSVIAGAGSGKTQTMGLRVTWLVANGLVQPERVLGLTFTRKAAGELSARVRRLLRRLLQAHERSPFLSDDIAGALRSGDPTISTYHGYAAALVEEHGLRIGLEPSMRLLGEAVRWQYTAELVAGYDGPMDLIDLTPGYATGEVLSLAAELSEHLRTPEEVRHLSAQLRSRAAALPAGRHRRADLPAPLRDLLKVAESRLQLLPLVEALSDRKRARSAIDFGDQVALAARIAEDCPEAARIEQERFGVVLLDEYQDTGEAQRRLLTSLFGDGFPVVAVGDPRQSIYGWRGASAGNLERFPTDFPTAASGHGKWGSGTLGPGRSGPAAAPAGPTGTPAGASTSAHAGAPMGAPAGARAAGDPAAVSGLTVSFRNGEGILAVANRIAADIPLRGMDSEPLRPGPGRVGRGRVQAALLETVEEEAAHVAAAIASLRERVEWRQVAVLARKRSLLQGVEAQLRERRVPCEVVGLGGLLLEPEVVDLVATLRVLVDPLAGSALARLLTGPRWRLGPRDLSALGERAQALAALDSALGPGAQHRGALPPSEAATSEAPPSDLPPSDRPASASLPPSDLPPSVPVSLVDALDDLGPPGAYSGEGYARLRRLAADLRRLREDVGTSLPELVTTTIRATRLDIELAARPQVRPADASANLSRFLDEAEQFAAAGRGDLGWRSADGGLTAFLAYLDAAEEQERGLDMEAGESGADHVQLLTVHAAKGLEWDAVFVVGMTDKVFPVEGQPVADWTKQMATLPFPLRGDAADLPSLDPATWTDQKAAAEDITRYQGACRARGQVEERRLAYVAVTRARELLVCTGAWWDSTARRPRGPSVFLEEVREVCGGAGDAAVPWVSPPPSEAANPLEGRLRSGIWPDDPLGERRQSYDAAAALVRRCRDQPPQPTPWSGEIDLLLAEREREASRSATVELPTSMSVSALVALRRDPGAFARMLARPVPVRPQPLVRRGTRFHEWLESRWGQQRLLDIDELPGAADETAQVDADLSALQAAFRRSDWWQRRPSEIEFPFELPMEGVLLRGRIDAVFTDDPSGYTDVVDWKTGPPPRQAELQAAAVQLAAYRLAWSRLSGTPPERVRAAFHYVAAEVTLRPADLLGADELAALVRGIPVAGVD